MITMFGMGNTIGWAEIMYQGMASRGIDRTPKDKNNPIMALYFIILIVIGSFFIMNLFVGIVISNFNREKERLGKNFLLTDKQREWLEIKLLMHRSQPMAKPKAPQNKIRNFFFHIVTHKLFDPVIMGCIVANTLILMLTWYDEPSDLGMVTQSLNYFFAGVFTVEAGVKITSHGP
jgi:hypothetical protein